MPSKGTLNEMLQILSSMDFCYALQKFWERQPHIIGRAKGIVLGKTETEQQLAGCWYMPGSYPHTVSFPTLFFSPCSSWVNFQHQKQTWQKQYLEMAGDTAFAGNNRYTLTSKPHFCIFQPRIKTEMNWVNWGKMKFGNNWQVQNLQEKPTDKEMYKFSSSGIILISDQNCKTKMEYLLVHGYIETLN